MLTQYLYRCPPRFVAGDDARLTPAPRAVKLSARRCGTGWLLSATAPEGRRQYFYWLVDGQFVARTGDGELFLGRKAAAAVELLLSPHRDLDVTRWAARGRQRSFVLEWLRPIGETVDSYLVERLESGGPESDGSWSLVATLPADGRWSYRWRTPRLADSAWHSFRVVPVRAGNRGTKLQWAPRFVGARPDAPAYELTYDEQTRRVAVQ